MKSDVSSKRRASSSPLWGHDEDGYRRQPTVEEIMAEVARLGGELWLDDSYHLRYRLPKKTRQLKRLKAVFRLYRPGIFQYLLERRAKIPVEVACHCSQEPFAHLEHNPPPGDEPPKVYLKGDLTQLAGALGQLEKSGPNWTMRELLGQLIARGANEK